PRVLYTDQCCEDRALMAEIFKELREEGHDFSVSEDPLAPSDTAVFTLPSDVEVACIHADKDTHLVVAAASNIREQAEANDGVIGLDIEWEISRAGGSPNPPATVQLAAGKLVVLFHVLHGQRSRPEKLPSSLVALLGDARLAKTGVGVKGYCTRLRDVYGAVVRNVSCSADQGRCRGRLKGKHSWCS
ncbi:unnamed protein product, partial [Laminaria digitata]